MTLHEPETPEKLVHPVSDAAWDREGYAAMIASAYPRLARLHISPVRTR